MKGKRKVIKRIDSPALTMDENGHWRMRQDILEDHQKAGGRF
jgi:hypothetical protein